MVSFTHHDAGTSEEDWAASGAATLPELPLDAGELADLAFIVLAAHPDDESLGAGGLMARLHALGAEVRVLLCTAGEASHPGSATTTADQLAGVRLREFGAAVGELVPDGGWRYLGLPDGKLAGHRSELLAAIREAAAATGRTADRVVLVAPYRHDSHTDHDALGSAAAEAAAAAGHGLLEYPVWYWLWASPEDRAWQSWRRLPLSPAEAQAKAQAMAAHTSQVRALSPVPGDEVLLPPAFLEHFSRPWETFAWQPPAIPRPGPVHGATVASRPGYAAADAERLFDAVHARNEDPWQYTSRWYERRKRALTLAALPSRSYSAGLEIGCSIGTLSAELAERCGSYLAVDASSAALAHADRRLARLPAAETRQLTVPREWPEGAFDLIVLSEVGYYLAPEELAFLFERVEAALLPGGTLVLCHWRHPIDGWELDGDAVHAAAHRQLRWPDAGVYRERDFVLEILQAPELHPGGGR